VDKLKSTGFPLLSKHRPLRRPGRDDGSLIDSHIRRQRCEAGGLANKGTCDERHKAYRRTHSQGSPSDKRGRQPLNILRQKAYCGQPKVVLQLMALFAPKLWEIQEHPRCPRDRAHEPGCTSSYNNLARAG